MAITAMRVPTIFTAVDRFSGVVSKMAGNATAFGQTTQAAAMRTSRKMNSMGTTMLSAGAGMAVGLGYAVNEAGKFEKAISNISTLTENTPAQMKVIADSILGIAKNVPVAISDLTEGGYDVVSAGITGTANQLNVLNRSAILAVAGLGTTKEAVDITTSSLNAFGIQASESERVTNLLMKTVKYGKTTVSGIAESFGSFASIMKNSGVTLDEYLASAAALTTTGMSMSRAQTQVSSATTALIKPNLSMLKIYQRLGVKDIPAFIKKNGGLVGSLQLVDETAKKMGVNMSKVLGRKEGLSAMLSLLGAQKGKFLEIMGDMASGTDVVNTAFAKQQKTFSAGMQRMKNSVGILAIKIGEELLPRINGFLDRLTPTIDGITDWMKKNSGLADTLLTVTMGLLGLGIVLKVGSLLMLGYARTLALIEFATASYTAVVGFLALGLEGMAISATYAAAGLWATIWPLALLGAAVWAVVDMVQHWEDWNGVIMLSLGPLGAVVLLLEKITKHWDNISNSFQNEGMFSGIKSIGTMLEDFILSPLVGIFNIMGRIPLIGSPFKEMAADLESVRTKIPSEMNVSLTPSSVANLSTYGGIVPQATPSTKPKNLAGGNGDLASMLGKVLTKQEIELVFKGNTDNLEEAKVNGKNYWGGIPVKTTSTTGKR